VLCFQYNIYLSKFKKINYHILYYIFDLYIQLFELKSNLICFLGYFTECSFLFVLYLYYIYYIVHLLIAGKQEERSQGAYS